MKSILKKNQHQVMRSKKKKYLKKNTGTHANL